MGEGVTGPHLSAKFNPFGLLNNVGLKPPKSPKFLVKICPKGVYLLNRFLPNLAWGRRNSSAVALKMWP